MNNKVTEEDERKMKKICETHIEKNSKNYDYKETENEEFYLSENKHKCRCDWNHNGEIFVSYNGNECNDFCMYNELDNFVPFLYVIDKKLKKLKAKPIILNMSKFFNVTQKKPRLFEVINFNN